MEFGTLLGIGFGGMALCMLAIGFAIYLGAKSDRKQIAR